MGLDDRIKTLEVEMKDVKKELAEYSGALKFGRWLTPLLAALAVFVANRIFPPMLASAAQPPAIISPAGHP